MRSLFRFSVTLAFLALLLAACGSKASSPVDANDSDLALGVEDAPTEPEPQDPPQASVSPERDLAPGPSTVAFNLRATGSGTAVVEGVPYTFEVYLCGAPVAWNDKTYPDGSEETAFYVDPGGAELEILDISGAGTQEDGAIFEIRVDLDRRSGLVDASISHIVRGDPSQSWSYYSGLNSPQRLEFDPPRFKSVEGGLTFFNEEDPIRPIRLSFEATCETYGGTFDTMGELAAEVTDVSRPGAVPGSLIFKGEPYDFVSETCIVSQEDGRAGIEGKSEQLNLEVSLVGDGGPQFVKLTLRDPERHFQFEDIWEGWLVIEGTRLYAQAPFELTDQITKEMVLFSLDVTCPEIGS
jgi:hypothetical protein